jgi:hypothetical protein
MLAYHFVGDALRDGRPVPADGEWLVHEGPVEICVSGLHASKHPFDALSYAPGGMLCLVECEDIVTEYNDKFVCRRRKIVRRIEVTGLMHEFARICALSVIDKWDAPDVVRRYLETGDESIRAAARDAARAAAWAAAGVASTAASAAARAAAGAAAGAATWAAARDAALDAALYAAWAATRAAALDEYKSHFARMVDQAFEVTP